MLTRCLRPILFGILSGILACVAVLLILSAVATAVDIPPMIVVPLATVASAVGAFVGAVVAARITGRNGWLVGLITSFGLFLLSAIVGVGTSSPIDGGFLLTRALIMLACGLVGGMLAVNLGKRKTR